MVCSPFGRLGRAVVGCSGVPAGSITAVPAPAAGSALGTVGIGTGHAYILPYRALIGGALGAGARGGPRSPARHHDAPRYGIMTR